MQKIAKKSDPKTKDESTKKVDEKKLKKGVYTISTPRDFVQKSTTADIYAQKKKSVAQSAKAPKKLPGNTNVSSNDSPMKGLLKSSASSVSQLSRTEKTPLKRNEAKASIYSARKHETPSKQPTLTSVTVNSPAAKKKLDLNSERTLTKEVSNLRKSERNKEGGKSKEVTKESHEVSKKEARKESTEDIAEKGERQRTKTRTLDESEVKVLTSNEVDNNAGLLSLTQKLAAKPIVFFVDLDIDTRKAKLDTNNKDDEDVSYEDDFESYESDFESYHSDKTDADAASVLSEKSETSATSEEIKRSERNDEIASVEDNSLSKEKDEEKMLDSGNFDLRDQRSAKTIPAVMDFILEDVEGKKTVSLTDEGFQDMSQSMSSMKTVAALDRPQFIDFSKSKQNKLKRKIHEKLKQRATDLLGMITLHEMTFSLYEMKPISYDLFMATFGRSNYTQSAVQTFEDGITQEIQTDEIAVAQKWTQHPVEFSKNDIFMNQDVLTRKYSKQNEDYLTKFTFMLKQYCDEQTDDKIISDEKYKANPLRIYFEQKDGAGGDQMLPYETYKSKLKNNDYNSNRLGKFLKKYESRVSLVLTSNTGHKDVTNLLKSNKLPFSKGFVSITTKNIINEKLSFLKLSTISRVIFSETRVNLILTVHKKAANVDERKSLVCLWDLSVANAEPLKILTAIDDVIIGRFRGNAEGLFVAALEDGSIHLWDLSEEPTWRNIASEKTPTEILDSDTERLTQFERDREWNLMNSNVGLDQSQIEIALQSCAFTSSAANMTSKEQADCIVGLEMNSDAGNLDAGRRVVGQIISLQRIGILTIWSIIQEKLKSTRDIGKAFLSKMKLEKCQTILLSEHIDISTKQSINDTNFFNLNAAKRRLSLRKKEKIIVKKLSRPQSAVASKFDFDFDRPSSAASMRKQALPVEINYPKTWETGIVCNDMKIMSENNVEHYLVAKNCGEVLCCRRRLGAVKIQRFSVATDTSSVTNIAVASKGLPYFLAATDTGTVNLCSLLDNRVLLTLDCSEREPRDEEWAISAFLVLLTDGTSRVQFSLSRNVPNATVERCHADHKGRFVSSVTSRRPGTVDTPLSKLDIKSVNWSAVNPCSIYVLLKDSTLLLYELTHSDIYAKCVCENTAVESESSDYNLALLSPAGDVQVHKLSNDLQTKEYVNIFKKYVALL